MIYLSDNAGLKIFVCISVYFCEYVECKIIICYWYVWRIEKKWFVEIIDNMSNVLERHNTNS